MADPREDFEAWKQSLDPNTKLAVKLAAGGIKDLASIQAINYINLSKAKSLDFVQYLTNLEHIRLATTDFDSLEPLAGLTKLVKIELEEPVGDTKIEDISPLGKLAQLETLDSREHAFSDLTPLANTSLKSLALKKHPPVSLQRLPQSISYLRIAGVANDVSALADLTELVSLDLTDHETIPSKVLGNLKKLQALRVKTIESIDPVLEMKQLEVLWLDADSLSQEDVDRVTQALPDCEVELG